MYRSTARDFLGSLLDAAQYHPFLDRLRLTRLQVAYWRRLRPAKFALLRRINLGCGPNHLPGMCNVDVAGRADLRFNFLNRFPLPSGVAQLIYCEHALEHFHVDHVRHILGETHRILGAGGVLRISVPMVAAPGTPRVWDVDEMAPESLGDLNRRLFGHEHKSFYSAGLLVAMLREAGFRQVEPVQEGRTRWLDEAWLRGVEHRVKGNIIVEARKEP